MILCKYQTGECSEDRIRLISVVLSDRTRNKGHRLEHGKFPLEHQETLYCEDDGALDQVVQRGYVVSSLEIFDSHLNMVLGSLL